MGVNLFENRAINSQKYPWGYGWTPPWSPSELSLLLWLDADDAETLTVEGGKIAQWSDKSGKGNHATQSTAAQRPDLNENSLNGKNTVYFSGDGGKILLWNSLSVKTIFCVAWWVDHAGSWRNIFFPQINYHGSADGSGDLISTQYCSDPFKSGNGFKDGAPLAHADFLRYLSPTIHVFRHDSDSWPLEGTGSQGSNYPDSRRFKGDYAEILALTYAVNEDERQKVEGYLAHKWGLAGNLPADHPYKDSAP